VKAPWVPQVPFNRPTRVGGELESVAEALSAGRLSGDGPCTIRCQKLLEAALGVPKVLLTTSCTHALEMAALLLEVGPGDEVVVPAFTFVSTVNAFLMRGARPVFVDIRPDTLNLDETLLADKVSERTRAIVPIHYAGIGAAMEAILAIGRRHGVPVVEDNAHGLFGKYGSRSLGSLGELGTLSFHDTKNFTCGEGGALLINESKLVARAEIIREKGTNRGQFLRGEVEKYTWVDIGSSYLPSEILAAFLLPQLEAREWVQERRKQIWESYHRALAGWATEQGIRLPQVPAEASPSYHLYYLLLPTPETRDRFLHFTRERGIQTVFHYLPLHLSAMGRRFGGREGDHPVTERLSASLVRLPLFTSMTDEDQDRVIAAVLEFES